MGGAGWVVVVVGWGGGHLTQTGDSRGDWRQCAAPWRRGEGEISVYAPSLIVPAGQEQSTVLSYCNISCESVNEVKRGAEKKKKNVVSGTGLPLGSELAYLAGVAEANVYNM